MANDAAYYNQISYTLKSIGDFDKTKICCEPQGGSFEDRERQNDFKVPHPIFDSHRNQNNEKNLCENLTGIRSQEAASSVAAFSRPSFESSPVKIVRDLGTLLNILRRGPFAVEKDQYILDTASVDFNSICSGCKDTSQNLEQSSVNKITE